MSGADLAKDKEKADRTDEASVKASGPDKAGAEAAATDTAAKPLTQIGRASCRERV